MRDLWIPGIPRVDCTEAGLWLPRQGDEFYLHTWHSFETGDLGYDYSPDGLAAARYLKANNKFATFVLHPITGALVQLLPADVGASTLKGGPDAFTTETNCFGTIHMQTEAIANAIRPFTLDLTREGIEGLTMLMNFLRTWDIPDQWAWIGQPPPIYPTTNPVERRYPEQSGHAYHSGWPYNTHGDPGAIAAPWLITSSGEEAPPVGTDHPITAMPVLETELKSRGFTISCGPSYYKGGICPSHDGKWPHLPNSTHTIGGAIDVGRDPAPGTPISTYEKAWLDDLARELMRRGFRVIWGVASHYDHLHVDFNLYGEGGGHNVVFQGPNGAFTMQQIRDTQRDLKALGFYTGAIDGLREAGTLDAIKRFQKHMGLTADGEPGEKTQAALDRAVTANVGFTIDEILWVQEALKRLRYYKGVLDGLRETNTISAVMAFQKDARLNPDGLPGENTQTAIQAALKALEDALKPEPEPEPTPQPEPAPAPAPTPVVSDVLFTRLAGSNRYATAVLVSQENWPHGSNAVYLAMTETDDLAVTASGYREGPLLIMPSDPSRRIPRVVRDEIVRLDPKRVVFVGGDEGELAVREAEVAALLA